jgi:mannan endo-1,6-alpha-mannosidase
MTALSVIGANLMTSKMVPLTANTGGTSKSDPNAGATKQAPAAKQKPITTADKAGAGILTLLVILGIIGGSIWLIM